MCCGRPNNPRPNGTVTGNDPKTQAVPGVRYQVLKLDGTRTEPVSTLAEAEAIQTAVGGEVRTVLDR